MHSLLVAKVHSYLSNFDLSLTSAILTIAEACILLSRPFGSAALLGGYDRDGPQLYMIEPSGVAYVTILLYLHIKTLIFNRLFYC